MKLVFITNSLSHHQIALCDALYARLGDDFSFITLYPTIDSKVALGQEQFDRAYEHRLFESEQKKAECHRILDKADCIIIGTAHYPLIEKYLNKGTLTLRYGERPFKKGKTLRNLANMLYYHNRFRKYNIHMLCASAYAAADYAFLGNYVGKTYKWGYFTRYKQLNKQEMISTKNNAVCQLAWVGRMIDWKHPEVAINLAASLKKENMIFHLTMIGDGYLRRKLEALVEKLNLKNEVSFIGNIRADQVTEHLYNSNIVILTSNYEEGWGAVLNEAMANGCVAIASHATGSAPFLINNGHNGYIYHFGHNKQLLRIVEQLIDDHSLQLTIGQNAYATINTYWNGAVAAENLTTLIEALLRGKKADINEGPCSVAPILKNNWFKYPPREGLTP